MNNLMKEENEQNCYNILKTTILMEDLKFNNGTI